MLIIAHRVNDLHTLPNIPTAFGAEIDVRYHDEQLVLWHDPFHHPAHQPCTLEAWLEASQLQGPLILNLKTEGIEAHCIDLMRRHGIRHYFFLDMSMPYCVKYALQARQGSIEGFTPENLAVRFSEYEALEYALGFAGMARWLWVDCFSRLPLDAPTLERIRAAGFRTCLVSPELQQHAPERIEAFRQQLQALHYVPDAVCTKYPDRWLAA